jgi:hypothetical protein
MRTVSSEPRHTIYHPVIPLHATSGYLFHILAIFVLTNRAQGMPYSVGMKLASPTDDTASSLTARKITRKQLATHYGLSVRTIDELTRSGVLGHFKIGKSIRYDFAETETTLRERFHVGARTEGGCRDDVRGETHDGGLRTSRPTSRPARAGVGRGRAGCPQPAASEPTTSETQTTLRERFHVGAKVPAQASAVSFSSSSSSSYSLGMDVRGTPSGRKSKRRIGGRETTGLKKGGNHHVLPF